jgi:HSP20 family protein
MLPLLSQDFEPITYEFWRPFLRELDSDHTPRYEVDETDSHYVMSFDVPGVHRDDLSIEMTGNQLTVAGERKAQGHNASRRYGKFQQVFTLPEGVSAEGIVAEHKDGVLRLAIQKPAAMKATRIKIADGAAQQRSGGFFKNLVGDRSEKKPVEIQGATAKNEPTAMAH